MDMDTFRSDVRKLLTRATALGLCTADGRPVATEQMEELVAAMYGHRSAHDLQAKLATHKAAHHHTTPGTVETILADPPAGNPGQAAAPEDRDPTDDERFTECEAVLETPLQDNEGAMKLLASTSPWEAFVPTLTGSASEFGEMKDALEDVGVRFYNHGELSRPWSWSNTTGGSETTFPTEREAILDAWFIATRRCADVAQTSRHEFERLPFERQLQALRRNFARE